MARIYLFIADGVEIVNPEGYLLSIKTKASVVF
jgi:hypothetical protein